MIIVWQRQYRQRAQLPGTGARRRQHHDGKSGSQSREGRTATAEPEHPAIDAQSEPLGRIQDIGMISAALWARRRSGSGRRLSKLIMGS